MAVIAAINHVDRLVLLEDGRELPITGYYCSTNDNRPLNAGSELRTEDRCECWEDAEVFTVDIPGSGGAAIICEMGAVDTAKPSDIN